MSKNKPSTPTTTWPVEIIRSDRRAKTVSAQLKGGVLVVRAPAAMSDEQLEPIIANFQQRIERKTRPIPQTDDALEKRAQELNKTYFEGKLRWQSIRYVTNQTTRHGSCTPSQGTIRISDKIAHMPHWVRDYVLVHELAHLLEANHGRRFWKLVNRYPLAERARGYLIAKDMEVDDA